MRKLRRLPRGKQSNDLLAVKAECGPGTLISSFEEILQAACNGMLAKESMEKCQEAFDIVTQKLSITPIQAIIISMIIDHNAELGIDYMADFLGIRNIRMLTYMNEINDLIERRIIRVCKNVANYTAYALYPAALQAYMENKVYTPPANKNLSLKNFISIVSDIFGECENRNMTCESLAVELKDLVNKNQRLNICKAIKTLDPKEQIIFMVCCIRYVFEGDRNICEFQYNQLLTDRDLRSISNSIRLGCNPLLHENLITYGGQNGMGNKECITVSDEICEYLNTELNLLWCQNKENFKAGLKLHGDIVSKQLYYNEKEKKSIDELTQMLCPEQFLKIQERLLQNGMRKGFACIFHGAPGTGKTETVLQLARITGRDIMEVNISSIKSKWVGDTEKNIKSIFNRYRLYCKRSEVPPILLFNEADAIISKRNENVSTSVDRMENAMQNIILEEMEQLEGILIATTNLTSNMDKAFERRFLYKIEFCKPDLKARTQIWKSMIQGLTTEEAEMLADEFHFSGGQIENVARKQIVNHILYGTDYSIKDIRYDCLSETLQTNKECRPVIGFR